MSTIQGTIAKVESKQYGLKWERNTFSLTPVWTVDPSIQCIEDICYDKLRLSYLQSLSNVVMSFEFLDEGAFHRVYMVEATGIIEPLSDSNSRPASWRPFSIAKTSSAFHCQWIHNRRAPARWQLSNILTNVRLFLLQQLFIAPRAQTTSLVLNGCFKSMFQGTSFHLSGNSLEMLAASE